PNHFDPELAAKKVDFAVTVKEIYRVNLPAVDERLAEKFGFKTVVSWRKSLTDFLTQEKETEAKFARQADFLKQLSAKVAVELPESLIDGEIDQMEERWRQFLTGRQISADQWLRSRNLTLEQMKIDWRGQAIESVKVGLGVSAIAK
ncbi:MAG: hypothetical protein AAB499_03085, partial [Patescibacteria group bacterium]